MNKRERVQAALRGEVVDRVPVSLWGHFYDREHSAEELAASMVAWQRTYDWDFLKVQARASYHGEVWGARYGRSPDGVSPPPCLEPVLRRPEDWQNIDVRPPDEGVLGEQLAALRLIRQALPAEVPVIQTVFAPLTVAYYLCGQDEVRLRQLLLADRQAAKQGLHAIAKTFQAHLPLCLEAGADGFFYSLSLGPTRDFLSPETYAELVRDADLAVLAALPADVPLLMLHICRAPIVFELVQDYPVHCFNWSVLAAGNPSLVEVLRRTDKAVAGGLPEKQAMVETTPEALRARVRAVVQETGGRRLLLAGGCSQFLPRVPPAHFWAVKEALSELSVA
ncbi:MAG: hypothetical protein KatS3mg131_3259 [Candidatus Tectimicrobiota bacterium]|nr:MAG: hypothetical protein KatS3mg131_3259 [Candidatus Tectomicrobia bacterium]